MANNEVHKIRHTPERIRCEAAVFQSLVLFFVFSVLNQIGSELMAASPSLPFVALFGTREPLTNHLKSPAGISLRGDGSKTEHGGGEFEGKANIWLRGSSSAMFPKKPYRLELVAESGSKVKAPLLGMPKESDWILFPAYADKTMMRDVLGYELWRAMGHYSVRWRYVELFIMTNSEVQMVEAEKLLKGERREKKGESRGGKAESGKQKAEIPNQIANRKSEIENRMPPLPHPPQHLDGAAVEPKIANQKSQVANGFSPLWRLIGPSLVAAPGARTFQSAATNEFTNATELLRSNRISNTAAPGDRRAPAEKAPLWHPPMRSTAGKAAPPPDEHVDPSGYQGVYILMEKIKRGKHRVDIAKVGGGKVESRKLKAEMGTTPHPGPLLERGGEGEDVGKAENGKQKTEKGATPDPGPLLGRGGEGGEDLSGGYIFKKDRLNPGETGFRTSRGLGFAFEEPKERDITPAQRNWLTNYLNEFERVLFSDGFADPTNGYAKFIDVDSFIDFHWMVEATRNIDGYRFSEFYYKDRGGKLAMGPVWDMDMTWGNAFYHDGYKTNGWRWQTREPALYGWYGRLFDDPDFMQKYIDRWAVLRTNVFATSNLLTRIDQWTAELGQARVRNYQRWPTLGTYVSPNRFIGQTFEDELGYLKNWITGRLAWIDSQGFPAPAFQTAAQESSGANKKVTITCAMGKILYTLDGSDPRLPGGIPSPKAVEYVSPVTAPSGALLTARVRSEYELWSAPAVFRW